MDTPSLRRSTPRLSKANRRAQLLEVAANLFADSSFGGVTTSALARAAGVSEPVLYQHFSNKEELYREVLTEGCMRILTAWRQIRHESASPLEAVMRIVRQQYQGFSGLWTFYKLHLRAISEAHDPRVAEILNENNTRYHDILRIALQEAKLNGEITSDMDTSDLAWLMLSQGMMLNYSRQIGLKGPEHSGYLDRLLGVVLGNVSQNTD